MNKRLVLVLGAVALIASVRPAYLVGVSMGFWQPLSRPAGVSARARYVDAFKSNAWFECAVERVKDVNTCRAWDANGT